MRFGYLPVAPEMALDEEAAQQIIADYTSPLESVGGERWSAEQLSDPAPLFYFLLTGGTESEVLRLREERSKLTPEEPFFLLAHLGNNSLPASLKVLARLQQDSAPGRIFFLGGPQDAEGYGQIADAVHDFDVRRALRRARIGCVGEPSDWLVASTPDPAIVSEVWGPEVVPIALDPAQSGRSITRQDTELHREDTKTHGGRLSAPPSP